MRRKVASEQKNETLLGLSVENKELNELIMTDALLLSHPTISFSTQRERFADDLCELLSSANIVWATIVGVSVIPVDRNNRTMLLGREKGGQYRGQYSFIGGKVPRSAATENRQNDMRKVAHQAFDELLEELRVVTMPFTTSTFIGFRIAPCGRTMQWGTLQLIICSSAFGHVTPASWQQARAVDACPPGKYREMTAVRWCCILESCGGDDDPPCSVYVQSSVPSILDMIDRAGQPVPPTPPTPPNLELLAVHIGRGRVVGVWVP